MIDDKEEALLSRKAEPILFIIVQTVPTAKQHWPPSPGHSASLQVEI
jgi:hypothetical protein